MSTKLYKITKIVPHDGIMKEVHYKVMDTKCHIFLLTPGMSAILFFQLKEDPKEWHRLLTSAVHEVFYEADEVVRFTTNNTDYILVRCEEGV